MKMKNKSNICLPLPLDSTHRKSETNFIGGSNTSRTYKNNETSLYLK
jgi:hypothetical protein